jgi:hypothetical protein
MNPPLLLYSTSTWMAYSVAERWYAGLHYAWCSPVYDGRTAPVHVNIPPSSNPAALYNGLLEATRRGDLHSESIQRNAAGIKRGAESRRGQGVIGEGEEKEIIEGLGLAQCRDFRPVLYVIPFHQVEPHAWRVPVSEGAHPMSIEYLVEALPRASFDMIELTL